MSEQKNIVEAYREFYGQLIILISGLSGSKKNQLSHNISKDFKMKEIKLKDFYKKDYDKKVKLPNDIYVINYDSDDAVDWDAFNKEVNNLKQNGVLVVGEVFPTDKLDFKTDYHIHLKITKQDLNEKRRKYIEEHPEKNMDLTTEKLRVNTLTYPYYLESLKRMRMDKFIEVLDKTDDEIYDIVFDSIINFINKKVYEYKPVQRVITEEDNLITDTFDDTFA